MKSTYICESCGKVMKESKDFAGGKIGSPYCKDCGDEFGHRKNLSQVIIDTKNNLIDQMAISEKEAEQIAIENISQVPLWARQQSLGKEYHWIIITDVGSTTTKALLLSKQDGKFRPKSLADATTTVEQPTEDVNIGVYQAIRKLEENTSFDLLTENATDRQLQFKEGVLYLTTSSAGGGLQLLVIGLTLFDSAGSGQRAAYGAGGVILDTFAIDDKRSSLEQMKQMNILHPDIILMAGGVNGGAVSPLLRLGEILQMAKPSPKFGKKNEIPLVFAGNEAAQPLISSLFNKQFELYLIDNIRPTMQDENLQPAREKIHKLFMENVMEQAPGYSQLKQCVADDIIPTPLGVIKSLQLLSKEKEENIMSVDIGGATTDIFSNILGSYFRTVSANYGMSYSISNVMKDTGLENLSKWIPAEIDDNYVRNYISNKMLYPGFIPDNSKDKLIEMAIAREAIAMAKKHHLKMNFKTSQIGFLDKLTKNRQDLEKITEAFYLDQELEKKKFHMHDINIIIGAGGVVSHADNSAEALMMVYDGFEAQGITEIWRDKDFITPHLGKLSSLNEDLAKEMLDKDCFEPLAVVIRPIAKKWKPKVKVMEITIGDNRENVLTDQLLYIENRETKNVHITMNKGYYLNNDNDTFRFTTDLPLLIDTRLCKDISKELDILKLELSSERNSISDAFAKVIPSKKIEKGDFDITLSLPYAGNILVKSGDLVTPETVLGENLFDPPKIYVISLFDKTYLRLNPEKLKESILIKKDEEVKYGQRIVEVGRKTILEELQFQHYYFESPVRGRVEKINFDSGTIIMREIQDYSTKPKKVNVAGKMSIKPKLAKRYLKKQVGEFVYAGDTLASRIVDTAGGEIPMIVSSPSTGTIKDYNNETGIMIIQYDKTPYQLFSGLTGQIKDIKDSISATISYTGSRLKGIIGFGSQKSGPLKMISNNSDWEKVSAGDVITHVDKIDFDFLRKAESKKVSGIVAPSMDNADLVKYIGQEIGVALTGNEPIPLTLILTEGFGDFKMDPVYREFFKDVEGKWAFVDGHTQIRAGVVRPTIIVTE